MRIVKSLFRRGVRQLNKWRLISPELTSRLLYFNVFGRFPDIDNPKDLNEKILAQAFRGDTSQWSRLADKYAVRAYVVEKGLGDILVPMYGVWDRVEDIDFEGLPDSFVLKTTDGFARTIIVKDKGEENVEEVRGRLMKWMNERRVNDEPHYMAIKRCIIAEQLLPTADGKAPTDYKIFCCNGKAMYCLACTDRDMKTFRSKFSIYKLPEWSNQNGISKGWKADEEVPCPSGLGDMMEYAERLADSLPLVRIDFYEVGGKVYFGEITLTSSAGREMKLTQDMLDEIGNCVILPEIYKR